MPQNRKFQQYDAVKVYAPEEYSPFYVIGRIIGINTHKYVDSRMDRVEYCVLYYGRHGKNVVIHVTEDRLRIMPMENPPFCPSNKVAKSYIEDSYEKNKEITDAD